MGMFDDLIKDVETRFDEKFGEMLSELKKVNTKLDRIEKNLKKKV